MNVACTSNSGIKLLEIKNCFLAVVGLLSKFLYASRSSKCMHTDILFWFVVVRGRR